MGRKRKEPIALKGAAKTLENGHVVTVNGKEKIGKCAGASGSIAPETGRNKRGGNGKDGVDEILPPPVPVRTSSRVHKRFRRDNTPPPSPPKKTDLKAGATSGTPEQAKRRQWELWSATDKDIFFEALNEHGKDFEAISSAIAQRQKKKGGQHLVRTKEQIRHFYYRTWKHIQQYVKNDSGINKNALELYGLINYGEIKKRTGSGVGLDKIGPKLDELVQKGVTTMKVKGRSCRIRTPACRALKKINNIEEAKEEEQVTIPKVLTLELRPSSNTAWSVIQDISQNPRLRLQLPANKRLSSVIAFLTNKWKSQRLRLKESMNETEKMIKELRLAPPPSADIYPFDLRPVGTQPNLNLAMEKFCNAREKADRSPAPKRVKKSTISEDHHSEDSNHSTEDNRNTAGAFSIISSEKKDLNQNCEPISKAAITVEPSNGKTILTDQKNDNKTDKLLMEKLPVESDAILENSTEANDGFPEVIDEEEKEREEQKAKEEELRKERINTIREGWNILQGEEVTMAEVYLLLGCPDKLCLEYDWVDIIKRNNVVQMKEGLTNMLRRLVQLATTEFSDFAKNKHPMGGPEPTSPPSKACSSCGAVGGVPLPGRNSTKSPRTTGGGGGQTGKSPSTPKSSQRPGTATTPGNKHGNSLQPVQKAEQSEAASVASSQPAAPGSAGDGVFRVPNPVPIRPTPQVIKMSPSGLTDRQLLQQLELHQKQRDILMPKRQRKQIMRSVRRPLVVQRALLPKPGVASQTIMALKIDSQSSQTGKTGAFMPVAPQQALIRTNNQGIIATHTPYLSRHILHQQQQLLELQQQQLHQQQISVQEQQQQHIAQSHQQEQHTTHISIANGQIVSSSVTTNLPQTTSNFHSQISTPLNATNVQSNFPGATVQQTSLQSTQPTDILASSQDPLKQTGNSLLSQAALAAGIGITDMSEQVHSTDTNLSSFLDISLPAPENTNDSISSENSFITSLTRNTTFSGLLDAPGSSTPSQVLVDVNEDSLLPPSASSPTKAFKLNTDSQSWMGGDDFSLSQFLNVNDSPLKKSSNDPSLVSECSRDSIRLDVDTALQSMMNENSMEYSTKFADLAAQIAASAPDVAPPNRKS